MRRNRQQRSRTEAAAPGAQGVDSIEGVLHFDNELGTRGGYWAVWDKRFIRPNTTRFVCRKCHVYWDNEQEPDGPSGDAYVFTSLVEAEQDPKACPAGEHEFELASRETWSYDGLHVLADGDQLTIYDKIQRDSVVWSGTIRLRQYPRYTEKVFGYYIHADQEGVQREVWARWFFDNNPAKLIPSPREPESCLTTRST